ncbi:MAG: hypothetical protein LUD82_02220 [Clostridiales bacterium]|nr:hypothetical protein [Clostridiales bacterium]
MRWKKVLTLALCMALLCAVCRTPAAAISTSATSTYVIDVDSGRVLYENNADEERPIASITKIMTALVAIEASTEEELAQVCTVSAYAASVGGQLPVSAGGGRNHPPQRTLRLSASQRQ